jgi:1-acyl-sn-glycerol-3-phosphate acyltransferase
MFRLLRATLGPLLRLAFDWHVTGPENVPRGRPYVIVANHLNWIDPWALLIHLPAEPRIHFLANPANLVRHRLDWWAVRQVGGYIPVDLSRRAGPELFRHVNRCLERGGVVALFPEAAYGPREGELQPMKRGFAHFASDNRVPVAVSYPGCAVLSVSARLYSCPMFRSPFYTDAPGIGRLISRGNPANALGFGQPPRTPARSGSM